mmetsp:Transcript_78971/g.180653  ORF Transcript_78971/g.180653 Transcript_78971/m.180653 type:complete len:285 (-) Transcript_78971:385-1239(-)
MGSRSRGFTCCLSVSHKGTPSDLPRHHSCTQMRATRRHTSRYRISHRGTVVLSRSDIHNPNAPLGRRRSAQLPPSHHNSRPTGAAGRQCVKEVHFAPRTHQQHKGSIPFSEPRLRGKANNPRNHSVFQKTGSPIVIRGVDRRVIVPSGTGRRGDEQDGSAGACTHHQPPADSNTMAAWQRGHHRRVTLRRQRHTSHGQHNNMLPRRCCGRSRAARALKRRSARGVASDCKTVSNAAVGVRDSHYHAALWESHQMYNLAVEPEFGQTRASDGVNQHDFSHRGGYC